MARSTEVRPVIKLRSIRGTGYTYVTRKNRCTNPDRFGAEQVRPRRGAGTSSSARNVDAHDPAAGRSQSLLATLPGVASRVELAPRESLVALMLSPLRACGPSPFPG
jgi:large subunit ribosomal protein L33